MQWIKQPNIPVFIYRDVVTSDMLNTLGEMGINLADKEPLYPVVDFTDVKAMPRNLMNTVLQSTALMDFLAHKNTRMFVFISPDTTTRLMIDNVFRNLPVKIVDTQAEAKHILLEEIFPHDNE